MKYLLFFMMMQRWVAAAKLPTSKELSDINKYPGVRIENDAAIISLGKKQGFILLALAVLHVDTRLVKHCERYCFLIHH